MNVVIKKILFTYFVNIILKYSRKNTLKQGILFYTRNFYFLGFRNSFYTSLSLILITLHLKFFFSFYLSP